MESAPIVGFIAALVAGNSGKMSDPVVINLDVPGEAILLTLDGKPAGGLRVDNQGCSGSTV